MKKAIRIAPWMRSLPVAVAVSVVTLGLMGMQGDRKTKTAVGVVSQAPAGVTFETEPELRIIKEEDPMSCSCGAYFVRMYADVEMTNDASDVLTVGEPVELWVNDSLYPGSVTLRVWNTGDPYGENPEIATGETRLLDLEVDDPPKSFYQSADTVEVVMETSRGPLSLLFENILDTATVD